MHESGLLKLKSSRAKALILWCKKTAVHEELQGVLSLLSFTHAAFVQL